MYKLWYWKGRTVDQSTDFLDAIRKFVALSDNCPLTLPVVSFMILTQSTCPTAYTRGGVGMGSKKRKLSDKIRVVCLHTRSSELSCDMAVALLCNGTVALQLKGLSGRHSAMYWGADIVTSQSWPAYRVSRRNRKQCLLIRIFLVILIYHYIHNNLPFFY